MQTYFTTANHFFSLLRNSSYNQDPFFFAGKITIFADCQACALAWRGEIIKRMAVFLSLTRTIFTNSPSNSRLHLTPLAWLASLPTLSQVELSRNKNQAKRDKQFSQRTHQTNPGPLGTSRISSESLIIALQIAIFLPSDTHAHPFLFSTFPFSSSSSWCCCSL